MRMCFVAIGTSLCLLLASCAPNPSTQYGVWVTVFSEQRVLYSKEAINSLIRFSKENDIQDIYLQILRSGEAYYESKLLGDKKYKVLKDSFGSDPIDYFLKKASQNQIRVHAWINVLSLAQNKSAPIIAQHGDSVLTKDKNGRSSIRTESVDDSDKFYLRDDQYFLEPGDERVVDSVLAITQEIQNRYPTFHGIHLDYIRYPYPVPYLPDSRFTDYGISYGFSERNLERFKRALGLNPKSDAMTKNDLYLKWDAWKRNQITSLVRKISEQVKIKNKRWKISCAVIPNYERAYQVASQDWNLWLKENLVDYVILMNYTRDSILFERSLASAIALNGKDKIHTGVGIFMLKSIKELEDVLEVTYHAKPAGVAFFAYDEAKPIAPQIKSILKNQRQKERFHWFRKLKSFLVDQKE